MLTKKTHFPEKWHSIIPLNAFLSTLCVLDWKRLIYFFFNFFFGLRTSNYTSKIEMWNLGQFCKNLIFSPQYLLDYKFKFIIVSIFCIPFFIFHAQQCTPKCPLGLHMKLWGFRQLSCCFLQVVSEKNIQSFRQKKLKILKSWSLLYWNSYFIGYQKHIKNDLI